MANIFKDQAKFMKACEQTVGDLNEPQLGLYLNLIAEEYDELKTALAESNRVEALDALLDIIVVTTGAIHSLGADGEGAWKEVMATNFAKIDKQTGRVRLREDGKVLKPLNWKGPELGQYLK